MNSAAPTSPAFKEWQAVVAALRSGRQSLILRKGGIAEGPAGFQLDAPRFWLFPTQFHAQAEKLKPGAELDPPASPDIVRLDCFAQVHRAAFVKDWDRIAALAPFHLWTEETVRERYDWASPAGLYCIVVRVFALDHALSVPLTAEMGGCKSWVELPIPLPRDGRPVLEHEAFDALDRAIGSF